jgi:hypothetical protein
MPANPRIARAGMFELRLLGLGSLTRDRNLKAVAWQMHDRNSLLSSRKALICARNVLYMQKMSTNPHI